MVIRAIRSILMLWESSSGREPTELTLQGGVCEATEHQEGQTLQTLRDTLSNNASFPVPDEAVAAPFGLPATLTASSGRADSSWTAECDADCSSDGWNVDVSLK